MRRKPAACSKVLGPKPHTSSSAKRSLKRPLASRCENDVAGQPLGEAGNPPQERRRRGVELAADPVDHRFDRQVELGGQALLVDVVLVLADAERFGLDLDQLGERILEPPGDRHRAAQRNVELGQLLARHLGRRIDRGAGFRHDGHDRLFHAGVAHGAAGEGFGLAAGGAVADGHRVHLVAAWPARPPGRRLRRCARPARWGRSPRSPPPGRWDPSPPACSRCGSRDRAPSPRRARAATAGAAPRDWRGRPRSPRSPPSRAARTAPRW